MVKADESNGSEPEQYRKMFVGGLTANTTDEMLREFYDQWGQLVDCIVMRDSETKRSRGFGFVTYATRAQVDAAMSARPHTIDGKTVDPKRAVPRELSTRSEANVSTKRLYVSGVREDHTNEMFRDYFQKFGPVAEVEVIQDKNTGKNRGFAFVTFEDYDAVDKCILDKSHMVDGKRCDVKKALSKEEMRKAQQSDRERMDRGVRSRGGPPGRGEAPNWGYGGGGGAWGGGGGPWGAPGGGYAGGYGGGYGAGTGGGWGAAGGGWGVAAGGATAGSGGGGWGGAPIAQQAPGGAAWAGAASGGGQQPAGAWGPGGSWGGGGGGWGAGRGY